MQRFKCPTCFQNYDCPPVTIALLMEHMARHGEAHTRKWYQARMKEIPE